MRRSASLLCRALVGLTALGGSPAVAGDLDLFHDLTLGAKRVQDEAKAGPVPDWLRQPAPEGGAVPDADRIASHARSISEQALRATLGDQAPQRPVKAGRHVEVFVSLALGEAALRAILAEVAGREDTVVVFRGLREGDRIPDMARRIHRLIAGMKPPPNVSIDPPLFRKRGVQAAPEIVVADGEAVLLHVKGIGSVLSALSMMDEGKAGDLGTLGPTREIEEADLITVMQARAGALDLTGARDRAIKSYWQKARFEELPPATEFRDRTVDPTVIVTRDVRGPDGTLLARQGQTINPLTFLPFRSQLVIFDPTSEDQIRIVEVLLSKLDAGRPITLMATRLDRGEGWEGLKRLDERLKRPVYLLTPELRQRFQLERVPSLVVARGQALLVREMSVTGR